jgi:hypothetical protein
MKKRMAKAEPKQKTIAYQLISPESESGRPLYDRLEALVDRHHEDISHASARIALAWAKNWKPDVDGRLTLGKCKKATDLDRELAPWDYVILLNREWWLHPRTTEAQREAVLDHECCHMAISVDKETGEPLYDDRGRNVRVGNTIMRALASWTPTSRFATSNETRKPEGSVHDGVELLDPEADNAADGECSVEHASRSVRTTDGHGRQLRQSKTPVPADVAPSWWCAVPANGFTNVAVAHAERMRSSKEHFQVRLRLLQ